ncbi:MAG: class F sortase, partial [Actinomycetia bacterium]|nr:class F sortase [Actinomycetes bacterium]
CAVAAGCGYAPPAATAGPTEPAAPTAAVVVGAPVSVTIPALGVTDNIVPVGLEPDGQLQVPAVDEVGWYTGLPKPGENGPGPALLAGHVNWDGQAGSFARIGDLTAGTNISVTDQNGVRHEFEVFAVAEFDKDDYGRVMPALLADTAHPELRLVTCSGTVTDGEYSDNTVVSARLVTP